jgi:hypothetical protein
VGDDIRGWRVRERSWIGSHFGSQRLYGYIGVLSSDSDLGLCASRWCLMIMIPTCRHNCAISMTINVVALFGCRPVSAAVSVFGYGPMIHHAAGLVLMFAFTSSTRVRSRVSCPNNSKDHVRRCSPKRHGQKAISSASRDQTGDSHAARAELRSGRHSAMLLHYCSPVWFGMVLRNPFVGKAGRSVGFRCIPSENGRT